MSEIWLKELAGTWIRTELPGMPPPDVRLPERNLMPCPIGESDDLTKTAFKVRIFKRTVGNLYEEQP